MTTNITIEELLRGTTFGDRQSVGPMEIIPILGDDNDDFAPPDIGVSTSHYGTVVLDNDSELPTIVPTGAGWVVKQAAQDHAIGGAVFLAQKQTRKIDTAACIQSTQGGYISKDKHEMLILPAALRAHALAKRKQTEYGKLWEAIGGFNKNLGINEYAQHLEYFLTAYEKTLNEFVAEFEVVPNMLGAIVLINGVVVGIEIGPNEAYWGCVWRPLIRVCYGSLAIECSSKNKDQIPKTRVPFTSRATTIDGLLKSLEEVRVKEDIITKNLTDSTMQQFLQLASCADERLGKYYLSAVVGQTIAGQIVHKKTIRGAAYVSACVANIKED